jgi:predicted Fe-Mo cluster-binding NifX family protein
MSRIAVMMSANRPEAPLSGHFGKAPWIMLADEGTGAPEFVQNEQGNGRSASERILQMGCTDVLLREIGDGALARLQAAGVQAWAVLGAISGNEALHFFAERALAPVPAARSEGKGHGGCCCGSSAGHSGSGHSGAGHSGADPSCEGHSGSGHSCEGHSGEGHSGASGCCRG